MIRCRRRVIRSVRASIRCMQEGVRVESKAIRETLARIRSNSLPIRLLRASIRCVQESVRVRRLAIRETLARIRSCRLPIRKRQEHVRDNPGEGQERIEEFCVQRAATSGPPLKGRAPAFTLFVLVHTKPCRMVVGSRANT